MPTNFTDQSFKIKGHTFNIDRSYQEIENSVKPPFEEQQSFKTYNTNQRWNSLTVTANKHFDESTRLLTPCQVPSLALHMIRNEFANAPVMNIDGEIEDSL